MSNAFVFANSLNHLECNSLLRNSHALISTNDLSNLGNPVLESIYYGTPIISLNDQSLDGFLTNDVDSKLIDVNHDFDKNLALAIQKFTEDHDYYSRIKNGIQNNQSVNSLKFQQNNESLEIEKILIGVK